MKPNISTAGRIARAITGLLCVILGILPWLVHWPRTPAYRWTACVILVALGLVQLFEAKRGWCVTRACGI